MNKCLSPTYLVTGGRGDIINIYLSIFLLVKPLMGTLDFDARQLTRMLVRNEIKDDKRMMLGWLKTG